MSNDSRDLHPDAKVRCDSCGCGYNPQCLSCQDALYDAKQALEIEREERENEEIWGDDEVPASPWVPGGPSPTSPM